METTQNPVELNLVNRKKKIRGRRKKSNVQQNSGQVQEEPEEGCSTSINRMNIMSKVSLSDERNSEGKVLSLATDETNSFSLTNALPHLSHDNCKVLINANSFSMTKSEVQDTVLGVDSTICPSFPRIEQNGMETSQDLAEVNLVRRKKRRNGSRKKKTKTLQNSGQAQELPEQGCLTSTNDMNITPTPSLSNERKSEETLCPLFARIKQTGMETIQNPVELNLVNRKKRKRGSRKKSNVQQNSGQVQEEPEEGCLTSINRMNIMSTVSLSDERNSKGKVLSLATDETNSVSLTNALPHLSHDNCKVLINANSFSMTKSEVQDTVLGVDSTICPSFHRIEQNGMETSQNLAEVNLVRRKKRRKRSRKKTKTLQNSGQAQELQEQGCLTSTNDMNITPTPSLSNERNCEEKVVLLGTDESISFSVTNSSQSLSHDTYKVFTNANSSSMARSEVQGTLLGIDLPLCLPFARSEQMGMETIQNPVVVDLVSQKKSRRRQEKKTKALQNNGQAEKLPEDGCVTSTNHMNIMSMPHLSDERNSEEKVTFWGSGENSLPVKNSSLCLSHENSKVVGNTDSIQMTKSDMQYTNLGVDSTMCPPFPTIEQMGMETAKNPAEVDMVMKKKARRRSEEKKPNTVVNIHQVPKEGSLTGADFVNTMSTPSLLNEKKSKEKVISPGAAENKQVCLAVAKEEDNISKISHISHVRAPVGHLKKKLLILDINGLLADIIRPPPKNYKSDINILGRAIFKRPFCHDFLKFCFERFEVGVWSSRSKKNVGRVIDYLMGDMKHKLLLCWDLSHCTATKFKTLQDKHKPIVFKELRKIWEKGDYNVTIEPHSEDDWEVLELNAEHAEAAILNQVRIVHEAMKFPLWLHGRTVITFLVVSVFPKKAVVQLVPGTEVAVAPKRRKKNVNSQEGHYMQSSTKEHHFARVLLRIQDSDRRFIHRSYVNGVELGVALTSVAFIHSETAKSFSLDSLQLVVIIPRSSPEERLKNSDNDALRTKSSSTPKVSDIGNLTDKKKNRQAVVHLLISESVAKGHVMIAKSLRLYLGVGLHSWVCLKACNVNLKKDIPFLSLSPCHFKKFKKNKVLEKNALEVLDTHKSRKVKNMLLKTSSGSYVDHVDWSIHDEVVAALCYESPRKEDERDVCQSDSGNGLQCLLRAWFLAQVDAIASNGGADISSLLLGNETLLHFEVKGCKRGTDGKLQASSDGSLEERSKTIEMPIEISYLLISFDESLHGGKVNAYEIAFDQKSNSLGGALENLNLGNPVSFYAVEERASDKDISSDLSSLSWMRTTASDVINRMMVLLSPSSGMWFSSYNLPLPGHVLIYGPPGSGKTFLARAVAKFLEDHEGFLAHIIFVSCSRLASEKAVIIQQELSSYISDALDHAPSIVIFDDLDSIISSSSDLEGSQPSTSVVALTEFLTDIMDEYGEKRKSLCGIGPIAFVASVKSLENIPQSLSSSGRLDFHVQLPAPAALERGAILKHEIQRRSLQCSDEILLDIASKCDGYDAYDLEILVDRSVHAAIGRFLPSHSAFHKDEKPTLLKEDFSLAMHEFLPIAMRDITKSAPEVGRSGWDDVGGLTDIRNAIVEIIELPSKFPNTFSQAPLRLRSNILLYGPPGCGKTHLVGAAAAACSLRFISVKGPELLNKYIGASEQAVRDIFSKAAAAAPCLLFFDEFDSIAPKRGHDNTGVTDRVVNQFLTELDGVEVLTGVFVFAATSRPDLLDAALLRPGRLDRLLFCDFPSWRERLDILTVLSRKLPLAKDVDLDAIARITEGFSGADLQALLSDAQLAAVHELLGSADANEPNRKPVITDALLKSTASKARPSVSETEKRRLYGIYGEFLDSKRSVAAQSRDAKGKRATLA